MTGSIRTFDKNVRACAKRRLTEIATGIATSMGGSAEGYTYGVHHPLVAFNEEALPVGTAAFVLCAKR